jgi:hypothetical protein
MPTADRRPPTADRRPPTADWRWAALLAVSAASACTSEYDLIKIEEGQTPADEEEIQEEVDQNTLWRCECPNGLYTPTLYVDAAALQDCLGYEQYGGVGYFTHPPPYPLDIHPDSHDACLTSPASGVCVLEALETEYSVEDGLCDVCLPYEVMTDGDLLSYACIYNNGEYNQDTIALASSLTSYCASLGFPLDTEDVTPDVLLESEYYVAVLEECYDPPPNLHSAMTANTDYLLLIDPAGSYLHVSTSSESRFAPLVGAAYTSSKPAEVLAVAARSSGFTLQDAVYERWSLGLQAPMDLDTQAGTFTVEDPGGPLFFGRGLIDDEGYLLQFGMGDEASGTLNLTTGTWSMDYTQTGGASSLAVHLEGAVVEP